VLTLYAGKADVDQMARRASAWKLSRQRSLQCHVGRTHFFGLYIMAQTPRKHTFAVHVFDIHWSDLRNTLASTFSS